MKIIEISQFGGPEMLRISEADLPTVRDGDVLIRVAGIGMNRADILQRIGKYPPPTGASDILGLEVSGTIEATGERVCVLLAGGGYAEYVAAPRALCLPVPDSLDLVHAAALPEAMFTVAKNIFQIGELKKDEHLLVHGGASGIGTMAIQMAKYIGAKVSVTVGSDARCQSCIELGADNAINYKTSDYAEILKHDPVDVVLDMVGGDYIDRDISIMNKGGRHVSIAYLQNPTAEIPIPLIMQKNITVTGSTLRNDSVEDKIKLAAYIKATFWPAITSGDIKPVIEGIFPFAEAAQAHQIFEKGQHFGKILLKTE